VRRDIAAFAANPGADDPGRGGKESRWPVRPPKDRLGGEMERRADEEQPDQRGNAQAGEKARRSSDRGRD
jgi:hypothetical protein